MLSIITAQACCLANQADTLAIKGTACPILQIHTRSVSCSNKATTSKHKKSQVKHSSDVHLLKFVGKSLHFTKCPFGSSKYLDKFSFTGHCKSWTSPTCAMADWRNWLGKYSCGTSSSASLPSPDQVKHDEGKQKTGRTRWLICERFKIQTNSDVNKLWCYKRPQKTTPTIQQLQREPGSRYS